MSTISCVELYQPVTLLNFAEIISIEKLDFRISFIEISSGGWGKAEEYND